MGRISTCANLGSAAEALGDPLRRQYDQVTRLLKLRSHLIATGIHESRGALVALRGYSKLLLEGEAGAVNPSQVEYLRIIAENTNKLTLLLANLGRWAACEDLTLEPCDFVSLWRQTVRRLDWAIVAKAIRLETNLPNREARVVADAQKLAHALHLFLGDVIRLLPEGGEIVAMVSVSEEYVRVSISEPRGTISALSQPASQAAVEEMVRVHGGSFSARGGSDECLAITFTLPICEESSVVKIGGLE